MSPPLKSLRFFVLIVALLFNIVNFLLTRRPRTGARPIDVDLGVRNGYLMSAEHQRKGLLGNLAGQQKHQFALRLLFGPQRGGRHLRLA